jgi:hypothetical protein
MDFVHRPHPVEVKEERSGSGGGGFAHWKLQNSVTDFHVYNDTRKNPLYQELSSPKHAIQPNEQTNKINEYCCGRGIAVAARSLPASSSAAV